MPTTGDKGPCSLRLRLEMVILDSQDPKKSQPRAAGTKEAPYRTGLLQLHGGRGPPNLWGALKAFPRGYSIVLPWVLLRHQWGSSEAGPPGKDST